MWPTFLIIWSCLFAVFETIATANRRDNGILSENVRALLRTRTFKAVRAIFAVGWIGWFAIHTLTEIM